MNLGGFKNVAARVVTELHRGDAASRRRTDREMPLVIREPSP